MSKHPLGIAGGLTRAFIGSALTPLFILAALAAGVVALISLPREEEPQISVPLVDIHVQAPGLKADLDRIASAFPVRFVGHTVERVGAEPVAVVARDEEIDLADRDPADLFARAFAKEHGFQPGPDHLHAFTILRERV